MKPSTPNFVTFQAVLFANLCESPPRNFSRFAKSQNSQPINKKNFLSFRHPTKQVEIQSKRNHSNREKGLRAPPKGGQQEILVN